ncbi:Myo-inositol transporter 1 [Lasiodiplodia theobromae]|uniref:Myo-inositol transporter 1 n=2 Tax=Lasiodiplodia theobromae TaxID=45133 RepID=A0A5N5D802_9PEZI|nr:Myo-inositol transporter 1 [Lasiodiplodia theobromae]
MDSGDKNSISAKKQEDVLHVEDISDVDKAVVDDSIEETECGKMAWFISMAVSTGGFLFGYDTGVISSVLVVINDDLGHTLSSSQQELITSLTSGGALIGAIAAGTTADKYGRKFGIYLGCLLFIAGSIIQAASYSLAQMSAGRFIVGLGVGSAAMIIPLYIGEIAPARYRGRMIAFDNMSVTFGQLISYALGAAFENATHGWRYTVGIGAAPAILLALMLPKCPESPRQLISHGKLDEAGQVIRKIFPKATDKQVKDKVQLILNSVHQVTAALEDKTLWWQFKQLFSVSANARPLISTCVVMAVSQLGGFNTLMYYSGTLFGLVGFNKPVAVSIVVGATNFIFSLVCITLLDRFGRRIVVLVTCMGMCISLVIAAVAFSYIPISKDLVVESREIGWPGILVLITIICYVAFFASGVATISWVGTELLPVEVRALGTMVNTVTCWGCNIIIASTFLSMMKAMTASGAFGFYAGICFAGWLFLLFGYPEVKGLPLEMIRDVYSHGFGVKYAAQLQKDRKIAEREGRSRA